MCETARSRKKGGKRIMTNVKRLGGEEERPYVSSGNGGGKGFASMGFFLYILVMGILIFFSITLRISYNDTTEKLNREKARVKAQIHKKNLEISNLRNRKETLSSHSRIIRKIQEYRLGLRPSEYSQIKKIALKNSRGKDGRTYSGSDMKLSMR